MSVLNSLEPKVVWHYFEEICQIPRPSKKEEKIISYLISFAKNQQLKYKQDAIGNILISKPATQGFEKMKSVLLQSHIDMVCEKHSWINHDFEEDAIKPQIVDGWVKATDTTLGADDGIGVAAQLALLASDNIQHGPIECLFTVDEETGLTGAFNLEENFFESSILLNLDSEDDGELFIGCAGGIDTVAKFKIANHATPKNMFPFKISISGLKGGHSGDDIDKGLGNANKILNRFLWKASKEFGLRLSKIDGGNLRNAIAREAFAIAVIPQHQKEPIRVAFNIFSDEIQTELNQIEPTVKLELESCDLPASVISEEDQHKLLNSIYACPHGVISMSKDIKGLVETSTNLAAIKQNDNQIEITTSQRSSVESAKYDIASMVQSVFELAGANVTHGDGYPGWQPNTNSEILNITRNSYERLFNEKPIVRAIHAGLECGLFLEKYPNLDMISIGPTIRGAHSPDEKIEIDTVKKFWEHLLDILLNIPKV